MGRYAWIEGALDKPSGDPHFGVVAFDALVHELRGGKADAPAEQLGGRVSELRQADNDTDDLVEIAARARNPLSHAAKIVRTRASPPASF